MIDRNTQLCVSISARPSNFGTTVHNAAYRAAGLNFIYKSFAVTDIRGAVEALRALGIRGCGVSMPFKESVVSLVDSLDPAARAIGAVNTIVNTKGKLKGYNTDAFGALQALKGLRIRETDGVLIAGAGGVARAIVFALAELGVKRVTVSSRTEARVRSFPRKLNIRWVPWREREKESADLLINATPIGMVPREAGTPFTAKSLSQCRYVMDVVIDPMETRLVREARALGKKVAPGYEMCLFQAVRQFELYTGQEAPIRAMKIAMESLLAR